jgi:hypothetical protein
MTPPCRSLPHLSALAALLMLLGCAKAVTSPHRLDPALTTDKARERAAEIMRKKTVGAGTSGATHNDYGEASLAEDHIEVKGRGQVRKCSFAQLQPEVRAYNYVYFGPACGYGVYTQSEQDGKLLAQILFNLAHAPK